MSNTINICLLELQIVSFVGLNTSQYYSRTADKSYFSLNLKKEKKKYGFVVSHFFTFKNAYTSQHFNRLGRTGLMTIHDA